MGSLRLTSWLAGAVAVTLFLFPLWRSDTHTVNVRILLGKLVVIILLSVGLTIVARYVSVRLVLVAASLLALRCLLEFTLTAWLAVLAVRTAEAIHSNYRSLIANEPDVIVIMTKKATLLSLFGGGMLVVIYGVTAFAIVRAVVMRRLVTGASEP